MEEQLKQYLQQFVETLKEGGQFAMEQLPLFVHEYLNFAIFKHGLMVFVGIVLLFLGIRSIRFFLKESIKPKEERSYMKKDERFKYIESYDPTPIGIIHICSATFGTLFGSIALLSDGVELIKAIVAPRVYLIENLMNLL